MIFLLIHVSSIVLSSLCLVGGTPPSGDGGYENAGLHRRAAVATKMRNSTVWRRWLRKCGTPPSGDGGYTDEVYPRVEDEVKCHIASMQALDEDGEPNFNDAD